MLCVPAGSEAQKQKQDVGTVLQTVEREKRVASDQGARKKALESAKQTSNKRKLRFSE